MGVVIGLLKGVNVGGNQKIKMDALRALCTGLGLKDTATFIQSGNVVFRTGQRDLGKLARGLEDAIEKGHGFRPAVILRTLEELRVVKESGPFAARALDPAKLLVGFLNGPPAADLTGFRFDPEEVHLVGREVFMYFPLGVGQSKMSWPKIERRLGVAMTTRNWNTVGKLVEMGEGMG